MMHDSKHLDYCKKTLLFVFEMPPDRSKLLLTLPSRLRFSGLRSWGGISLVAVGVWAKSPGVMILGCGVVLIAQISGIFLSRK